MIFPLYISVRRRDGNIEVVTYNMISKMIADLSTTDTRIVTAWHSLSVLRDTIACGGEAQLHLSSTERVDVVKQLDKLISITPNTTQKS